MQAKRYLEDVHPNMRYDPLNTNLHGLQNQARVPFEHKCIKSSCRLAMSEYPMQLLKRVWISV